jgi:hypothetical protein
MLKATHPTAGTKMVARRAALLSETLTSSAACAPPAARRVEAATPRVARLAFCRSNHARNVIARWFYIVRPWTVVVVRVAELRWGEGWAGGWVEIFARLRSCSKIFYRVVYIDGSCTSKGPSWGKMIGQQQHDVHFMLSVEYHNTVSAIMFLEMP